MRSGYAYQNTTGIAENLVEEYYYSSTRGTLDKYNGRYCVTPEYPKGVYAYFCTFDQNNVPEFPYVIGPEYNCTPEVVMGPAIFEVPVIVSDDTPALLTIEPYISIKLANV